MLVTADHRLVGGLVEVGVLKESQLELHLQDTTHRLVDIGLGELALQHQLLHELRPMAGVVVTAALHIQASRQTAADALLFGFGDLVEGHETVDTAPVGAGDAPQSEALLQHLLEVVGTLPHHLAVDAVVAGHDVVGTAPRNTRLKDGEVAGLHLAAAHTGGGAVQASLGDAVDAVVLGLGDDGVGAGDVSLLLPRDDGHRHLGGQVGVLAEGLLGPSPAGIAGYIQIGGQDLLMSHGAGLGGDAVTHLSHQLGIKGLGQGQGHGEDGSTVPGDAVEGLTRKDGGDAQAGPLHQPLLHTVLDGGHRIDIVEVADAVVPHVLVELFGQEGVVGLHGAGIAVGQRVDVELHAAGDVDLADLLLQGHAGKKVFGALLGSEGGVLIIFHGFILSWTLRCRAFHGGIIP